MVGTALTRLCPPYGLGLLSLHGRVILRRLGPLVHSVVAHDLEDAKVLRCRIGKQSRTEFDAGLMVRYIDQVRKVPVTIDARERAMAPFGFHRDRGAL